MADEPETAELAADAHNNGLDDQESVTTGGYLAHSATGIAVPDLATLAASLGVAATAVGGVAKTLIEKQGKVQQAEIEAATRRLEITAETERTVLRETAETERERLRQQGTGEPPMG